jgi:hypothetical protein
MSNRWINGHWPKTKRWPFDRTCIDGQVCLVRLVHLQLDSFCLVLCQQTDKWHASGTHPLPILKKRQEYSNCLLNRALFNLIMCSRAARKITPDMSSSSLFTLLEVDTEQHRSIYHYENRPSPPPPSKLCFSHSIDTTIFFPYAPLLLLLLFCICFICWT